MEVFLVRNHLGTGTTEEETQNAYTLKRKQMCTSLTTSDLSYREPLATLCSQLFRRSKFFAVTWGKWYLEKTKFMPCTAQINSLSKQQ